MADIPKIDVLIVGAGLSGINAAYRIQTSLPNLQYTILESRGTLGGTWDLFRYPGIRSDSNLCTFGFPWRPWHAEKAVASGRQIWEYMDEAAREHGIDRKIQYHTKVTAADWTDESCEWRVKMTTPDGDEELRATFVIWSTGYYNYEEALPVAIPGLDSFKGTKIHPQFWPQDYDYTERKIAIIGSGATAITLVPTLCEKAARVTMIQRSPTYVLAMPSKDTFSMFVYKWLPSNLAARLNRLNSVLVSCLFYMFTQAFPSLARRFMQKSTTPKLPPHIPHDPHFQPKYGVWKQRLCIAPGGDFFRALRSGKVDVVTDTIASVTEDGILMQSGQKIDVDTIVTATGLQVRALGGARITINGSPLTTDKCFMWKGMMLTGVPNAAVMLGYTNNSWTLGADITATTCVRLLKMMHRDGCAIVRPEVEPGRTMQPRSWTQFESTYLEQAKESLPSCGDRGNWLPRQNYLLDFWRAKWGGLSGLVFEKARLGEKKVV